MTFNDKHHWVFPLVPNACAYAKLDDYFRKMQKGQIEVLQTQADFGEIQEVRKVSKSKQNRVRNRMGKFTNMIGDLGDLIQSSLTRAVRMISGSSEISDLGKLKEVEKLYQWEEQLIEIQKEKDDLANRKEVVEKESENSIISLLGEKEKRNQELASENKEIAE